MVNGFELAYILIAILKGLDNLLAWMGQGKK